MNRHHPTGPLADARRRRQRQGVAGGGELAAVHTLLLRLFTPVAHTLLLTLPFTPSCSHRLFTPGGELAARRARPDGVPRAQRPAGTARRQNPSTSPFLGEHLPHMAGGRAARDGGAARGGAGAPRRAAAAGDQPLHAHTHTMRRCDMVCSHLASQLRDERSRNHERCMEAFAMIVYRGTAGARRTRAPSISEHLPFFQRRAPSISEHSS